MHMHCSSLQTFNNSTFICQTVSKLLTIRSAAETYLVDLAWMVSKNLSIIVEGIILSTRSRGPGIRGGIPIFDVPQVEKHSNADPILLLRMFPNSKDIWNEISTR